MRIRDLEVTRQAGVLEVAAEVDGFRLWYRLPDAYPVARSADPFVAAALLPAMVRGEELEVDPALAVSPRLIKNLLHLQEIFHSWNPVLKEVPIKATTSPAEPLTGDAFSFFSAGVDSTYTFLKRLEDISHVVFIHGFDFYEVSETYRAAVERNSRFVQTYGKTLIPIETNHYSFGYRYRLSRHLSCGSCLGSIALLLGFAGAYIPSSVPYDEQIPYGSHPLTDPLWSNEGVEVIHDGCEAHRPDKLRKIVTSDAALANLRVCLNDMNVNCGRCEKCLRTMVPLTLLGAKAAPFPPLPPLDSFLKAPVLAEDVWYLKESLDLAMATDAPQHRELRDVLRRRLRRAQVRGAIRELDTALLDGRVRRLLAKRQPAVNIGPAPSD